ncbi:MAG: FadR/GntR family transcriptional regulator [Bacteroidales bacterium]
MYKAKEKCSQGLVIQTQENILRYLADKGYEPQVVLPKENELAEIIGVSRSIIREALSSLRTLGFLETKKKKGSVLIAPKIFSMLKLVLSSGLLAQNTIKDLYELRLMLEIGMTDYVFRHRNTKYISQLEEIVQREEQCSNSEEFREIDILFHSKLYEMSHNESLIDFQQLLSSLFKLYAVQNTENRKYDIINHRALLSILKTGNADSFRSAMRMHLERQYSHEEEYVSLYCKKQES